MIKIIMRKSHKEQILFFFWA